METMELRIGNDRRKHPDTRDFRRMTVQEAKQLQYGERVWFEARDGSAREVKINGAPKTWKRTPSRVEVPVKYGMYEYVTFTTNPDGETVGDLLVVL